MLAVLHTLPFPLSFRMSLGMPFVISHEHVPWLEVNKSCSWQCLWMMHSSHSNKFKLAPLFWSCSWNDQVRQRCLIDFVEVSLFKDGKGLLRCHFECRQTLVSEILWHLRVLPRRETTIRQNLSQAWSSTRSVCTSKMWSMGVTYRFPQNWFVDSDFNWH